MQPDDAELIVQAKGGDEHAFEQLVWRYEANVLHYLIRFVGSRHDALDVSQDVWIRVHRSLSKFKIGASFRAWLFRIARNCAITLFRARGREPARVRLEETTLLSPAPDYTADRDALLWQQVREGVGERAASALWMHYAEGLRMEEIAVSLGMRTGAVKVMMHRARTKLRSVLGDAGAAGEVLLTPERRTRNMEVDYVY